MARGKRVRKRGGFTLVELLVVIAIIGMLVGLALPVLNSAREKGRMMECLNNMRNVAQATQNYELQKRQYPGFINVLMMNNGLVYMDQQSGQRRGVSYIVPLLDYLDQPVLSRMWKTPAGAQVGSGSSGGSGGGGGSSGANNANYKIELKLLICPSDPPTIAGGCPLSYAVNTGMQDSQGSPSSGSGQGTPKDWAENGVFFDLYNGDRRVQGSGGGGSSGGGGGGGGGGGSSGGAASVPLVKMSNDYISRADGTAQTCMLSENVDAGEYTDFTEAKLGMVWTGTGSVDVNQEPPTLKPPDDNMRINVGTGNSDISGGSVNSGGGGGGGGSGGSSGSSGGQSSQNTVYARPSSYHPKGVNMAFCDGKVRFVSDQMDYYVYCLLMSSNGARVRTPGSNQVLPNFNRPLVESWYQ